MANNIYMGGGGGLLLESGFNGLAKPSVLFVAFQNQEIQPLLPHLGPFPLLGILPLRHTHFFMPRVTCFPQQLTIDAAYDSLDFSSHHQADDLLLQSAPPRSMRRRILHRHTMGRRADKVLGRLRLRSRAESRTEEEAGPACLIVFFFSCLHSLSSACTHWFLLWLYRGILAFYPYF
ncbi:hypothetical protein ACB092_12G158600 [Castanea dentata]